MAKIARLRFVLLARPGAKRIPSPAIASIIAKTNANNGHPKLPSGQFGECSGQKWGTPVAPTTMIVPT